MRYVFSDLQGVAARALVFDSGGTPPWPHQLER